MTELRQDTSRSRDVRGLIGWILLSVLAGGAGAIASVHAADFYNDLWRPDWAPPASVFGPVWTALYVLMAIAAWLVWRERGWKGARVALSLYLVQLVLNAAWSWLFFKWHEGLYALVDITLLAVCLVATVAAFAKIRPAAAVIMLPYLAWVIFATALNTSVYFRNPMVI